MSPLMLAITTLLVLTLGVIICATLWMLIETYRYERRRRNSRRLDPLLHTTRDMANWLAHVGKVEALNAELAVPLGFTMYCSVNVPTSYPAGGRTEAYFGQYRVYVVQPGRAMRYVFPDDITANIYDPEVGRQALAAAVSFLLLSA